MRSRRHRCKASCPEHQAREHAQVQARYRHHVREPDVAELLVKPVEIRAALPEQQGGQQRVAARRRCRRQIRKQPGAGVAPRQRAPSAERGGRRRDRTGPRRARLYQRAPRHGDQPRSAPRAGQAPGIERAGVGGGARRQEHALHLHRFARPHGRQRLRDAHQHRAARERPGPIARPQARHPQCEVRRRRARREGRHRAGNGSAQGWWVEHDAAQMHEDARVAHARRHIGGRHVRAAQRRPGAAEGRHRSDEQGQRDARASPEQRSAQQPHGRDGPPGPEVRDRGDRDADRQAGGNRREALARLPHPRSMACQTRPILRPAETPRPDGPTGRLAGGSRHVAMRSGETPPR